MGCVILKKLEFYALNMYNRVFLPKFGAKMGVKSVLLICVRQRKVVTLQN